MTILCAATACRRKMGDVTENEQKISFHRFPKDEQLKYKWVQNMRQGEWKPSNFSRLCSIHFEASCYRDGFNRRVLHSYAVPTIFQKQTAYLKEPRKKIFCLKNPNSVKSTDASFKEIQEIKKQLTRYKMLAARRGLKLKSLQLKHSRVIIKQAHLQAIFNSLKQKLKALELSILNMSGCG